MSPYAKDRREAVREYALWLALLVVTRALFLQAHGGSFIDEYLHVFAGQAWSSTGELASFYEGEVYERGRLVSWAVGLALGALGPHLWVAKLVPLALGAVAFACLIALSRRVWPGLAGLRWAGYGLVVASPFTLFNHFYVRMYVLYEAGLLACLALLVGLQAALERPSPTGWPHWSRVARQVAGLAFVNGLVVLGANEAGAAVVPAATAIGLSVIAVGYSRVPGRGPGPKVVALRLLALCAILAASFVLPQVRQAATFWLQGDLHFTSRADHKLDDLFFRTLPALTAFFAIGCGVLLRRAGWTGRAIAAVAIGLLAMHLVSSPDLQITRGVLYLMPLFLWVAAAGMLHPYALGLPRRLRWVALAIGAANLALACPTGFFKTPGIPTEISYIDYAGLYREVRARCGGWPVLDASPSPHIGLFYGVRPTAALFTPSQSKQDRMVAVGPDGTLATVYGRLPVQERLPTLTKPACLIVREPSAGRMLNRRFRRALKRLPRSRFAGISLYRIPPAFARRYPAFQ